MITLTQSDQRGRRSGTSSNLSVLTNEIVSNFTLSNMIGCYSLVLTGVLPATSTFEKATKLNIATSKLD